MDVRERHALLRATVTTATPRVRRAVASTWAFRAVGEREAAARFQRLAAELSAASAEPVVVQMAAASAEDERRHVRLCAALAATYGGVVRSEESEARLVGVPGMSLADRVLMEVVSLGCIAETLAATTLATIREVTRTPDVRAVVQEILRDEVAHGRIGWAHLAAERRKARGAWLHEHLVGMLTTGIPDDLFAPDIEDEDPEMLAHGELSRARRAAVFRETLTEVIFPGLEGFGVDASSGRAWLARTTDASLGRGPRTS